MATAAQESDDTALVALREELNSLRGKMFVTIESWGLPEVQERACKQLVRERTYATQRRLEPLLRES